MNKDNMKYRRYFLLFAAFAMTIAIFACKKKDDKTPTSASFSGKLRFSVPSYARHGDSFTMTPSGVYREDGGDFGYFWNITPKGVLKDTVKYEGKPGDGKYTFVAPDTLCTISITCSAFAKGYYNASGAASVTIVDPEKSVSFDLPENIMYDTDARDGRKFSYIAVGNTFWMAENFSYKATGVPFESCDAMADVVGMFYTGDEAAKVCPSGWRLPSMTDWEALCGSVSGKSSAESLTGASGGLMADAYFNGKRMWEFWPDVKLTNKSGFSAIPAGYASVRSNGSDDFKGFFSYAAFWSSDLAANGQGQYVYIYKESPDVMVGSADKASFAASVRCVKDR
jgi:hypothetical protein